MVEPGSARGTHTRAGNAMGRARQAALDGAVRAVAKYGARKTTMGDIAMLAGIAKATLYNHFRTKDDVYRATVAAEVDAIARAALARQPTGVEAVLAEAARLVGQHPAVRKIASAEPATLAALATMGDGTSWKAAHDHVAEALATAGFEDSSGSIALVLRYLASQLITPSDDVARAGEARALALALARAERVGATRSPATAPPEPAPRLPSD